MRKSLYVNNGERIKSSVSLLRPLCSEDVFISSAGELGWYVSDDEGAYYCIGSWTTVSPKHIKRLAKSYQSWYEYELKPIRKFDKDYVYNTVCEMLIVMYDCGLSLKTDADDLEGFEGEAVNPSRYPLILLDIGDELKRKLFNENIFYVGEFLKISFLNLLSILSREEINGLYEIIKEECHVDVYSIMRSSIIAEISDLKRELQDISSLKESTNEEKTFVIRPVVQSNN